MAANRSALGLSPERGIKSLVLAGYGAFFYLLFLLIYRVNATALSAKFLVTCTLRVCGALVLGFLAGLAGLFDVLISDTQSSLLYVLVGAFPGYAAVSLQRKAREWFKRSIPGTEPLPLELIDGIDDLIAERLGEMGISDIQHLSTTDPGDLTLRTLYPLERVIDWIDQAILITYLKEHVVEARQLGIRGAIDMRGTYESCRDAASPKDSNGAGSRSPAHALTDAQGGKPKKPATPKPDAAKEGQVPQAPSSARHSPSAGADDSKVLDDLATKSNLAIHVIYNIGASLVNDYQVQFLSDLWHRRGVPLGVGEAAEKAVLETLRARAPGSDELTFGEYLAYPGRAGQPLDETFGDALTQALDERLKRISLQWLGRIDDLRGASAPDQMEHEILRKVGYVDEKNLPHHLARHRRDAA